MNLREYEQNKFAIADILRSACTLVPQNSRDWQERQRGLFARLADDRFNLVCVGRFSRGKTSLMNAILGTDRLPTGIVPLTSVITSVGYGTKEQVILRYAERILTKEVPIEALPQYITQEGNPGNIQRIKMAEVQLRAEILRRGFYFVDTPGLGSAIVESTRTTEAFLPEADAFVLVTSYESALSDEEVRFFRAAFSSARRIFVVLNKQDTVSPHELIDVLRYVRDELRAFFGPTTPKIFSVSARQGLEAKQRQDAQRLADSGIPVLEEELLTFLLTEKTTEFLLQMCGRVADLVRDFSQPAEAADLVTQIVALARRISQDHSAAHPRALSVTSTEELPTLRQLNPCEVCAHVDEALWDFFRQFQYDITANHEEQRRLAEYGGLCSFHTWQYEDIASPYGTCLGYPTVLRRLAANFRGAASTASRPEALAAKIGALVPKQERCPVCAVRAKAESEAISELANRLAMDREQALKSLSAICLPHFAMLSSETPDIDLMRKLIAHQATLLERLSEDMERYALKRDALRRFLESGEEATAAERALLLLAGDRKVNAG
jgi:GTP-binding protein EngB required for normal cell division